MTPTKTSHAAVLERLTRLVTDVSPYRPSFTDGARHRVLLWGYDVPLRSEGFEALCRALQSIDQDAFVYSQMERFPHDDADWIVSCRDYAAFNSVQVYVESVLSSLDAEWVIICASEGHSIAASADAAFIDALAAEVGVEPLADALELLDYWCNDIYAIVEGSEIRAGDPDWIPTLFRQTLPPEVATIAIAKWQECLKDPRAG